MSPGGPTAPLTAANRLVLKMAARRAIINSWLAGLLVGPHEAGSQQVAKHAREPAFFLVFVVLSYGAPTQIATAAAISSICAAVSVPRRFTNLFSETDFTWKASAPDSFNKPFVELGTKWTNQGQFAYPVFQSVIGTTILSGSRPIVSSLITRAGLVFPISAPCGGSKLTFQTSPLFGIGAFDIEVIFSEGVEIR